MITTLNLHFRKFSVSANFCKTQAGPKTRMDLQKTRSLMVKNIGLQLGLSSDHCSEQLIAGIEKSPGGSKILQVLISLSKASAATRPMLVNQSASKNLKVAVAAATHKLDIPERPVTADIHRRQLQEELLYASFSNAVQKTIEARYKETESKRVEEVVHENGASGIIREHFQKEVLQSGINILQTAEVALLNPAKNFLESTEWINVHIKKLETNEHAGTENVDDKLFQSVQEAVKEREAYRRKRLTDTGGGATDRKDKFDTSLQSKIDFRVNKFFEKSLSFREFVNNSFGCCGSIKRDETVAAIQETLNSRQTSIEKCEESVQVVIDRLAKLQTKLKELHSTSVSHDVAIQKLREKITKSHEKIVKLSKISFNMRLKAAMDSITTKAQIGSYERALKAVQEEETHRKRITPMPVIDTVTGFEVPFCPWSETEIQHKVKAVILQTHAEYQSLLQLINNTKQLAMESDIVRTKNVPEAIATFQLARDVFVQQNRDLVNLITELRWNGVGYFSLVSPRTIKDSLEAKKSFLAQLAPFVPATTDGCDLNGLRFAVEEMSRKMAKRNEVAEACLDRLNTLMNGTMRLKGDCFQQTLTNQTPISDEFITPPDSGESGGFMRPLEIRQTEQSSGPPISFYTSTPFDGLRVKQLACNVSTIGFDQPLSY